MPDIGSELWVAACAVAMLAGFIKGLVGFAMPMVMISGLATFLSPELALAALILPTLATNLWQAARGGFRAAIGATRKHWRYLAVLWILILASAQLIFVLPQAALFLILGVPVTVFAAVQLAGWRMRFPPSAHRKVELIVATFSGFIGGLSGVWGPPTVLYLTALDTPKAEQMRAQGIIYGSGAVMLLLSHLQSGLFNANTAQFSALLLAPALLGMGLGFRVQDRIDQEMFRKITLIVLVVAGLNLIRRALFG